MTAWGAIWEPSFTSRTTNGSLAGKKKDHFIVSSYLHQRVLPATKSTVYWTTTGLQQPAAGRVQILTLITQQEEIYAHPHKNCGGGVPRFTKFVQRTIRNWKETCTKYGKCLARRKIASETRPAAAPLPRKATEGECGWTPKWLGA